MSAPAKSYVKPPIEEALVEFRFVAGTYDITTPGKLFDKVKAEYPKVREVRTLQAVDGGLQESNRVQFLDAEEKRLVSLGRDSLSVNVLKPYDGWQAFRLRVQAAVRDYAALTGTSRVERVGVRYINRIVLHQEAEQLVELAQYFRSGPAAMEGLPQRLNAFMNRTEHAYDDDVKLIYLFGSLPGTDTTAVVLLDLDLVRECEPPVTIEEALAFVDDLHAREVHAFESIITDELRKVLNDGS